MTRASAPGVWRRLIWSGLRPDVIFGPRAPVEVLRLLIPPALAEAPTGSTDPIRYYTRPGIGWLFRRRIELGLDFIWDSPPGCRMLEVGYGAGLVLYNLATLHSDLHGLDMDADPAEVTGRLHQLGVNAQLARGSVLDMHDIYPDGFFDVAVCFSVFEHLTDPARALDELDRVVKPGGKILIGMPAVNGFMEHAFQAIGFKGIQDHHITTPLRVKRIVENQPERWAMSCRSLPRGLPPAAALYQAFLLRKIERT